MSIGWLGTGFWHGPTVIGKYQSRPEREQAVFRSTLGIATFLIYWGYAAADMDGPTRVTLRTMTLYMIFGWATLIAVSVRPALSMSRLTVTTIVDQGRALNPEEIHIFFNALEQTATMSTLRLAVKFMLLTLVHKSEFIDAHGTKLILRLQPGPSQRSA